jgi:hypothetical protein
MAFVGGMPMAIVDVVHMVFMRDCDVSAAVAVDVGVVGVLGVSRGHE